MPDTGPRFAILQRSLEIPDVERLKHAFRSVKCLTDSDAHTLARDAFGILVKNLSPNDAMTLQGALAAEGIETAVVLENELPQLPPAKFVRQMECLPDALMVYDPIGRNSPVSWDQVLLVAAGNVQVTVFEERQVRRPRPEGDVWHPRQRLFLENVPDSYTETVSREKQAFQLMAEVLLNGAAMRFQIEAEKFRFNYLGDRRTNDVTQNLRALVEDLMKFAPQAMANRGAYFLRDNPASVFQYPSKNAFHEEITWMLWQRAVG